MEEIWKDVGVIKGVDFYGLYMVSNFGKVKSLNYNHTGKEKILNGSIDSDGYVIVCLTKKKKEKQIRVNRLVALTFIPIPEHLKDIPIEKLDVGHLKTMSNGLEDKTANEVWNLAWMSKSENQKYGTLSERKSNAIKGEKHPFFGKHLSEEHKSNIRNILTNRKDISKKVIQIDKDNGKIIAEFPSLNEINRQFGYSISCISQCCNEKLKQYKGFKWRYA